MASIKSMNKKQASAPNSEKQTKSLLPRKKKSGVQRLRSGIDWPFAILVLILLAIGTIFVFSSSYVYAKYNYNNSFFFIRKQIVFVGISILILILTVRFADYLWLKKFAPIIFIASYALLWAVFFFGSDANGAKRWIYLGSFSVQPSEIVKFSVILLISAYVVWLESKGKDLIRTFQFGILPFGVLAVLVAFPLILQPHLSATIIILGLIFFLMFLSGTKPSFLWSCAGIAAVLLLIIVLGTSHGQTRIDAWLHPENDIQNSGWQPLQSLYAIGSGGLWGVGLGASKQKHLYLPEPQNDYIFAIVCEEMGFVFAVAVIILFLLLIWRGFYIAKNAPSKFSSLLVMGIITQIGIQVFLNIGVVTGTLPSTGVSLPFFSYGGSSLMIFMAEMGVVLNVSKYSYMEKS